MNQSKMHKKNVYLLFLSTLYLPLSGIQILLVEKQLEVEKREKIKAHIRKIRNDAQFISAKFDGAKGDHYPADLVLFCFSPSTSRLSENISKLIEDCRNRIKDIPEEASAFFIITPSREALTITRNPYKTFQFMLIDKGESIQPLPSAEPTFEDWLKSKNATELTYTEHDRQRALKELWENSRAIKERCDSIAQLKTRRGITESNEFRWLFEPLIHIIEETTKHNPATEYLASASELIKDSLEKLPRENK